ncbi:hypothetical protein JCM8097_005095 [Rhodosporidiobolus ruineniae]
MTSLQSPSVRPPTSKPSLHLSLSPSPSQSPSGTGSHTPSRRYASWGSATSETYRALNALGDEQLGGLPSPLEFDRDAGRREFGFLPSSTSSSGGATGGTGEWGSWARSTAGTGRRRGDSIFQEIRDGSIGAAGPGGGGGAYGYGSFGGRSDASGWTSYPATTTGASTPTRSGGGGSDESAHGGGGGGMRSPPERSKTLSFFDSSSGALSPPPNPPSRNGSLKASSSSYHGRHGSAASSTGAGGGGGGVGEYGQQQQAPALSASSIGSWANGVSSSSSSSAGGSGGIGGWGAFPSTSTLPASASSTLSPTSAQDPLRASVASSSGGSWLDEAAASDGTGTWTSLRRGRGSSLGSTGGGGWLRSDSPGRYESPRERMEKDRERERVEETPSPVAALRPRLAALNTSSALPSWGSSSAATSTLSDGPLLSPSQHPLSSLPTAVDGPSLPSSSSAGGSSGVPFPTTTASGRVAARLVRLQQQQQQQEQPQPSSSRPSNGAPAALSSPPPSSSSASTSFSATSSAPTSLPATPHRPSERVKKSSAASTDTSVANSTSTTPRAAGRSVAAEGEEGEETEADSGPPAPERGERLGGYTVERVLGKGAFSRVALARRDRGERATRNGGGRRAEGEEGGGGGGELVALKLVARQACEGNERMRISVLREVEVLKNIHHPSLVSLCSTFSTPIYTVLILDFCAGGELFDFLADWHASISEDLARRMFGELCGAVGWMHEIGLVHRDIKLENILLTARPFPVSDPSTVLSSLPTPFIKLSDFGLSRFINPSSPLLSTRCGSEAYAAPELIMGKKYDGRLTDAWALGVVLFAVITGVMPFVEEAGAGARGRRAYLLRIAKADYRWPGQGRGSGLSASSASPTPSSPSPTKPSHTPSSSLSSVPSPSSSAAAQALPQPPNEKALSGPASSALLPPQTRLITPSVQSLVARLLVRDPAKRMRLDSAEVWESEWMRAAGEDEIRRVRVRGVVRRRGEERRPGEDEGWARRGSEVLEA